VLVGEAKTKTDKEKGKGQSSKSSNERRENTVFSGKKAGSGKEGRPEMNRAQQSSAEREETRLADGHPGDGFERNRELKNPRTKTKGKKSQENSLDEEYCLGKPPTPKKEGLV